MLERALIALVIIVLAVMVWRLYIRWMVQRLAAQSMADPLLAEVPHGKPVIVYFTTPFCVPCRTQQQPILGEIAVDFGESVHIIKVDATDDTATADRWGVLSAPTTFVLDGQLRPQFVNHGVATRDVLRQQLLAVAGS